MKVFRGLDLTREPADSAHFSGNVHLSRITGASDDPPVNIYRVEFEPRGRTNWHTHTGPQLLLVVSGLCRVQKWGEQLFEVGPGDTVCIAPGEKHWHGAGADVPMTHIAINIDARTTWLEKVSDEQYAGRADAP